MGLGLLFIEFLQPIAVGVVTVFALLLFIRLGIPRRSVIGASRRASGELRQP
jgi:hypothetical protein